MHLQNYIEDELVPGVFSLDPMSPEQLVTTRKLFEKQRKRGIYRTSYDENTWEVADRGERKRIHFEKINYQPKGMKRDEYIKYLKLYTCKCMDTKSVLSVADYINLLIALTNETCGFIKTNVNAIRKREEKDIRAFLVELGLEKFELNVQDMRGNVYKDNRRKLSTDFWTYFVMDYEIKQFWEEANLEEKLIYAPLYLFWIIGHILPMRPYEFCMIKRDCISNINGKYYISMPKSGIKGKPWRITNDRNTQDKVYSFQMDEKTAKEVIWYIDSVKNDVPDDSFIQERLFNNMAYNRIVKQSQPRKIEFSRSHLDKLKNSFLKELVKKGYKKVKDLDGECSNLEHKWISDWRLNDLRHLALINMIMRGIDPTIIMVFAGHDDITQACHYYSNVSEMSGIRLLFEKRYYSDYSIPQTGINIIEHMSVSVGMPLVGGMCLYNGPENLKTQICAKYYACAGDGCPYFRPQSKEMEKSILEKREKRMDKLMEYFVDCLLSEEKERAEDTLIELQRECRIYERSTVTCHDRENIQKPY